MAAEDMKVRLSQPPLAFDEKGNAKKYTDKELKELRGPDPKLPGYTGELSDVSQDKTVTVTLAKKRDAKPTPKGKEKDEQDASKRLVITRILLHPDPPQR